MPLLKKRSGTPVPATESEEVAATLSTVSQDFCRPTIQIDENTKVISTGSTLLDLAITGTRRHGGGVPGGLIMEVFGPSSAGKTAILAEMAAFAQIRGGDIRFDDPEARLDKEYSEIYGLKLKAKNYNRPDTVKQMFKGLWEWEPKPTKRDAINISCADSLAALSTEMEMEDEDKMGMKRAKDFSEGLRKTCRMIANNNWLIACSNQERDSKDGHPTTPGGKGVPYYASLRIRVAPDFRQSKITKTKTVRGVKHETVVGIRSICEVKKSSIDVPYRKAPICIVFGLGIDDIRANLEWLKTASGLEKFKAINKPFSYVDDAVAYIEANEGFEEALKGEVVALWEDLQSELRVPRKPKVRQ